MHFLSLFHCLQHCFLFIALLLTATIIGVAFAPKQITFNQLEISTYQTFYQQLNIIQKNHSYFVTGFKQQCSLYTHIHQFMVSSCLQFCRNQTCGITNNSLDPILNNRFKYAINNLTYFASKQIKNHVTNHLVDNIQSYYLVLNQSKLPLFDYRLNQSSQPPSYNQIPYIYLAPKFTNGINCSLYSSNIGPQLQAKSSSLYKTYYEQTQLLGYISIGFLLLFGIVFIIRTVIIKRSTGFLNEQNRGYTQYLRLQTKVCFIVCFVMTIAIVINFFRLQSNSDGIIYNLYLISNNCLVSTYRSNFDINYQRDSVSIIGILAMGLNLFLNLLAGIALIILRISEWRYKKIKQDVSSHGYSYQLYPM